MNNKYSNSKIYFLINNLTKELFYIGSTVKTLKRRLWEHKYYAFYFYDKAYECDKNNYIRLMNIDDCKGYNNISIHLLENYPCNIKEELLIREKYWIEILKPCCNMNKPIFENIQKSIKENIKKDIQSKKEERKKYLKEYREKNRKKLNEYHKKYYHENKIIIF